MKQSLFLLLIAALIFLSGCAAVPPTEDGTTDAEAKNLARIAELESELQKTKEESYIKESALTQEIEGLKAQLSVLTGQGNTGNGAGSSSMIFHYRVENGSATVTGFEGSCTLVQIPTSLDGYPVKKIGERAFEGNTSLAAVTVPEGVESIDWFAFYDCTSLLDVTLPASITSIGHAVFDGCNGVTVVCPAGSYAESYSKSYGIAYINS